MSDSPRRFSITIKIAAGIAIAGAIFYLDARPMLNWFDDTKAKAARQGWVVVPGTEMNRYIRFENPFTWFGGYTGAAVWIQEHYVGQGSGKAVPIGVRMCSINEEDREIRQFWLLFSSDRSYSEAFPIPSLDGEDANSQLLGLLQKGDEVFARRKRDRCHDEVLRLLRQQDS